MFRTRRLPQVVEPLELRRLLSAWTIESILAAGEHHPGCSCSACAGRTAQDPQQILDAVNRTMEAIAHRAAPATATAFPPPPPPAETNVVGSAPAEGVFPAVGQQPAGALTGRIVYIGAGHGWTANNTTTGSWYTQRPETNEMIEDMGNQDQMQFYANYLWNAGATVVPLRPIGNQTREVVLDNDDPGVTFTGTWSNTDTVTTTYFGSATDTVKSRIATAAVVENATATYTPNLPAGGFYPVYAWALDAPSRAPSQLYRVNHSGGSTEVRVDHRRVGKGWVYLGTFHFDAGASAAAGSVTISNKSTGAGQVVADAIRFGNGMGTITRGGPISGAPREDEAGLYWIEVSKGVGVSEFYRGGNSDDGDANVGGPTRWAAYMNAAPFGQAVHLSFHSNAGGGRGTVGLYNNESLFPNTATPNQFAWAQLVGKEVNDDLVAIGAPPLEFAWNNRANPTFARSDFAFGEIRTSANGDEFDSTILEVAFHDDASDAALMRAAKVRNWVGRASYQATVKYFNQFGANPNVSMLPEPPQHVRVTQNAAGDVTVSWNAPVTDSIGGQAPTGYRVYSSANGYGFDGGVAVAGAGTLSHTIPAGQFGSADAVYFRVAATNDGGESLPSAVVGVRRADNPARKVLVVNGFDRLDRALNTRQTLPNGGLVIDRVRPRAGNSFDYVVQAGEAIEAFAPAQVGFDSATLRSVELGHVTLGNYAAVIWLSGEQSTADKTFTPAMQSIVGSYVAAGGDLFVSGAEVGWDLDQNGGGAAFFNNTLKADYVGDDANTYSAVGAAGSIFNGLSLNFDNGALFYNVDFPDRLATFAGSSAALNYSGGTGGIAAVQFGDAVTGSQVVTMGFPFETITTPANRNAVMAAVLNYFFADLVAPQVVGGVFNYQSQQSAQVIFSENVGASLQAGDVVLVNLTTGQTVPAGDIVVSYNPSANVATFTFASLLPDGNYELSLDASGVTDPAGNTLAPAAPLAFFVLGGDANRDRTVGIADFSAVAANFNAAGAGIDFDAGDFNYDDRVDIADFAILAGNFNVTLPTPSSATPARQTVVQATAPSSAAFSRVTIGDARDARDDGVIGLIDDATGAA